MSPSPRNKMKHQTTLQGSFRQQAQKTNQSYKQSLPTQMSEDSSSLGKPKMKNFEDQRKKQFEARKLDLLKQFEVPLNKQAEFASLSPTSEQMKNSLFLLGDPIDNKKLTEFGKESISKFLQPLQDQGNVLHGKRPCARDGHKGVIYNSNLIIFGGDRHQMSFNDLYTIDLNSIL